MMKVILGILPWAIVLLAIGGAAWWLLSRDMAAGLWLLAALLIGHGLVHVLFEVPAPTATDGGADWPFDMARSWSITGPGLDANVIRSAGSVLIAVTVIGFALAGLSTVGILVPSAWWQPTVALAAVASAALLILFFEPQLVLGLGMDAVLLWVVATGWWVP
jgi:hypothetical protein